MLSAMLGLGLVLSLDGPGKHKGEEWEGGEQVYALIDIVIEISLFLALCV
jgi:hypothetical protein